jgi:hypothetical protein
MARHADGVTSSIQRLKARFELEYEAWKKQDLSQVNVVYMWADGLYVKAGIEDRKAALLVIVGALPTGEKVLLACESGERESKESWLKVLRDLKARGLKLPRLTVADGHLGIWAAMGELHPEGEESRPRRDWNHKITNVADDLPKKEQPRAREMLKAIPYADTRAECERLRDAFARRYQKSDPKAVATLLRDWERMVTFYAFPAEHWRHLRTTNIVESPFSAVRLRTDASRRYKRAEGGGHHLESAAGGRKVVAEAERRGMAAPGRRRGEVRRRSQERSGFTAERVHNATRGHRRLKPIYTPIDGGFVSLLRASARSQPCGSIDADHRQHGRRSLRTGHPPVPLSTIARAPSSRSGDPPPGTPLRAGEVSRFARHSRRRLAAACTTSAA